MKQIFDRSRFALIHSPGHLLPPEDPLHNQWGLIGMVKGNEVAAIGYHDTVTVFSWVIVFPKVPLRVPGSG